MSKERTVEVLERLIEAIRETFNNCKNFGQQMEIAGKMIGISQTLLGYYDRETEPMPEHIAEGVRQLDAVDAAAVEPQREDRLHNDLMKLEKRLDAIENIMKRMPEVYAAVFFQTFEEYQEAKLRGERASDIWEIAPPSLR